MVGVGNTIRMPAGPYAAAPRPVGAQRMLARTPAAAPPRSRQRPTAGQLQRHGAGGCKCGGTCGCAGAAKQEDGHEAVLAASRVAIARSRGELPLDRVLARAVLARQGGGGAILAREPDGDGGARPPRPLPLVPPGPLPLVPPGALPPTPQGNAPDEPEVDDEVVQDPRERCWIEVRAKQLPFGLTKFGWYHLYIVMKSANGSLRFFRGGPNGRTADGRKKGAWGTIKAETGYYNRESVDWTTKDVPRVTALAGPRACDKQGCFEREIDRINAAEKTYSLTGPNSNSTVATLLNTCGLPHVKPAVKAPGFSITTIA